MDPSSSGLPRAQGKQEVYDVCAPCLLSKYTMKQCETTQKKMLLECLERSQERNKIVITLVIVVVSSPLSLSFERE